MVANQIRAMDRMFERMMGFTGHRSPLAMVESTMDRMESMLSSIPTNGEQFTVWKLTPTTYRSELKEDGSILFSVVEKGEFPEELKGPDVNADKKV
jgi:hypothetical protein